LLSSVVLTSYHRASDFPACVAKPIRTLALIQVRRNASGLTIKTRIPTNRRKMTVTFQALIVYSLF